MPFPTIKPDPADQSRVDSINAQIPGWSGPMHYAFFREMLNRLAWHPDRPSRALVLGVYHGRDLAFIEDAHQRYHPTCQLELTGVDLFSPGPCADWDPKDAGKTWQEMGFGPNPDMEAAARHCPTATIVKNNSITFLRKFSNVQDGYDFIYFDTSHDENTLRAELEACWPCCRPWTILAGDDFADHPGWGVKQAVNAYFDEFSVHHPIWCSEFQFLRVHPARRRF